MASPERTYTEHLRRPAPGRSDRRPVLCLHCSTGSSRQWDPLATTLAASRRVVAPDLLGYGENSPWPRHRTSSLDDEIARLLPLLEHAGTPVDVVGHSFGAAVAVKLSLDHPELVRSLCVYEPVLFGLLKEDCGSSEALSEIDRVSAHVGNALNRGDDDAAAARFIDFWSGDGAWSRLPDSRRMNVRARIHKVRADFDALFAADVTLNALARLDVPVLCLSGERSPAATRRVVELLGATLPDVRCRRFDNAGHLGPITDAKSINASIEKFFRFLIRRKNYTFFTAHAA